MAFSMPIWQDLLVVLDALADAEERRQRGVDAPRGREVALARRGVEVVPERARRFGQLRERADPVDVLRIRVAHPDRQRGAGKECIVSLPIEGAWWSGVNGFSAMADNERFA